METRTADIVLDGRTVVSARPDASGPWPGVVMLHEGWGIDDVLRRHAVRLASAGYLVYAPDLLGEGPWLRCVVSTFRAFQARAGKPFELIESCRQALRADPDCTGKVGVIGFCMGGGFALLLSAEGYDAASVNYGMVPSDIDELAARAGPIVASYGGRDWTARRDAQLVMSLRRKYQKANQIAMMA
jgi:carboxymethylenebutenolidase